MKNWRNLILSILLLSISGILSAQEGTKESGVGEFMRSNQRSYVVIAVLLTILAGLIFYIVRVDRKISKLEKEP